LIILQAVSFQLRIENDAGFVLVDNLIVRIHNGTLLSCLSGPTKNQGFFVMAITRDIFNPKRIAIMSAGFPTA
jgi:hypothetical protein